MPTKKPSGTVAKRTQTTSIRQFAQVPSKTRYIVTHRLADAIRRDWMVGATGIEPVTPSSTKPAVA
jgi:hypothetical protein